MIVQGKLVVLYGGSGQESAVSKMSADGIFQVLKEIHEDTILLEYTKDWIKDLLALEAAFVFIAMHGHPGEDGGVQATLDELSIPYQGSAMAASVLGMDKSVSKKIFSDAGLDVAKGSVYSSKEVPETLPFYPAFLKPNSEGSSVGTYMIEDHNMWQDKREKLDFIGDQLLVEEYIQGVELAVSVVGRDSHGVIMIKPKDSCFFDYTSKYTKGKTEYIYPAPIATEVYSKAEKWALQAHKLLGCTGVSRVDFLLDEEKNRLVVLEVNTLPGMTGTSLVPKMAKGKGMSYADLLVWMIKDGLKRKTLK